MLRLIAISFAVILTTACGGTVQPASNNTDPTDVKNTLFDQQNTNISKPSLLVGLWESQDYTEKGVRVKLRIRFSNTEVISATRCLFPDSVTTYAQTKAKGVYDGTAFVIQENQQASTQYKKDNVIYNCRAQVKPATISDAQIFSGKIWIDELNFTKIAN